MKQVLQISLWLVAFTGSSQSLIQTVNSGSVVGASIMASVGEIVVVPQNQIQSNSGIVGILTQVNAQNLEVTEFELQKNIKVYPNPTMATLFFETQENLNNQEVLVYNHSGQLILQKQISADHLLDLTSLSSGIYLIEFLNKKFKSFQIIKH
jgi:Secretion system C-terminal sorting domain